MTTTPSDTPQDPGLRVLQREIESAIHPEGMHLNDGRARFSVANVQHAVKLVAHLEAELQKVREENKLLKETIVGRNAQIADLTELAQEKHETLLFVERWANHHGQKDCMTPAEALSFIQHYPPIKAITKGYADGKIPDTPNPWAELQKVRGELVEARKENERLKIESKEGWDNFYKMRKQYGALKYGGRLQNQVVAMDGNRNLALEEAAAICDAQSSEPECPERAEYCADAIRALKDKTP